MKIKTFDCVEMKQKGAKRIITELQALSLKEQLAYWKKAHQELLRHKK